MPEICVKEQVDDMAREMKFTPQGFVSYARDTILMERGSVKFGECRLYTSGIIPNENKIKRK